MKYRFYGELLQNTNPLSLVASFIQFSIKRKYNHIEFVAEPDDGSDSIYFGAVSPVSRETTAKEVAKNYRLILRFELKRQPGFENITDEEILYYVRSNLDIKYAHDQNIMLLFMAISAWVKKKLSKAQLNYERKMNCVEFFARPMVECFGYKLKTSFDATEFEDILKSVRGE